MSAADRAELEARVRRLEREGRVWRLAVVGAAAVALAASFRGPVQQDPEAAPETRLAVRELALVDDSGAERAVLALDDGPTLRFLGGDGSERLALGLPAGQPLLRLCDPDGAERAVWTVDAERAAMLTFSGRGADSAPTSAWLGVNERGRPLFELQARKREQRIFMGISDESPSLVVFRDGETLLRVPPP